MLLKSKQKVSFAIDTRAITTLTWACFDKFRFEHEAVSTARTIPAPLPAVRPVRCPARETGGLRLRKLWFSSAGLQPSSSNQTHSSFQPRWQRYGPCAAWHGRLAACTRPWKFSVSAPNTALHQSLFLKKYNILSSNYPAKSLEYVFEKLKACPDHSERSSDEGSMTTSAMVIREITWNFWRVGRTARFFLDEICSV